MRNSLSLYPKMIQNTKNQPLNTFENTTNNLSRHGNPNRTFNNNNSKSGNVPNFKHFLWGFLGLIIISYFIFDVNNKQTTYITKEGYYGSTSKQALNKFMRHISNDELLLAKQQILNGSIFIVPKDRKAILIDSDFGLVRIHLSNDANEFWTLLEAIKE